MERDCPHCFAEYVAAMKRRALRASLDAETTRRAICDYADQLVNVLIDSSAFLNPAPDRRRVLQLARDLQFHIGELRSAGKYP